MSFHLPMSLARVDAIAVTIALLGFLLFYRFRTPRSALPYPPGPQPLPFIGNVLHMPQSKFAITFAKLGEKYGPLTWLTIPGQNILVVNSFEAAKELLVKRPLNFIDRPRFTMAHELLGLNNIIGLSLYNEMWKKQRSHYKHALSPGVVKRDYSTLFERKAQQYVGRCIARPEEVVGEISRTVGETIITLTYGKLEDDRGRDFVKISTRITNIMVYSAQGYVVDLVPALRYLPKWLPGMQFKRDAARWKKEIRELEDTVFEVVQENADSNDPGIRSSFMWKRMREVHSKRETGRDIQQQHEDELALAYSGLGIFTAGLDTTEATIQAFLCAMVIFPSAQEKARAEIDRVVGSGRFPTFQDQPDLPFLQATILETLRWNPVASFGLPHVSREDEVYNGYFIPKGTSVIPNAWALTRDSKHYNNPSVFDPERYLKQNPELDPREFVFGYGRRICPGRDLAFQNVWILAATVLWAFEIVGGEDGLASLADVDRFSFGLINHPVPFECRFVPRREGLKDKIGSATA